jgi:hypothetical protein
MSSALAQSLYAYRNHFNARGDNGLHCEYMFVLKPTCPGTPSGLGYLSGRKRMRQTTGEVRYYFRQPNPTSFVLYTFEQVVTMVEGDAKNNRNDYQSVGA